MDQTRTGTAGLVRWDQQQAKAKFSEVVRRARSEGPQLVTTRGAKVVVVISADKYLALVERRPSSFKDLLLPVLVFMIPQVLWLNGRTRPVQPGGG